MREQSTKKSKIGARRLTKEEAKLILPTYEQIYDQINKFRSEKQTAATEAKQNTEDTDAEKKKQNQDIDQKTNNIGIIGVRGAGKTSVLKTIRAELQKEAQTSNDIILPIIVPENMSESSTLMATILGMLADIVQAKEQKRQKGKNEDCIKKSPLRQKCDEVIKQYTYIQKEYRNILLHEYTTENDYVLRSAKVFNSDTEFICKFNELVDALINENGKNNSLLFIFIDDIDLSTYRCADVVKTLLSYLSNENIVTFISEDLETFEEALTLDFLRKEGVLDKNVLNEQVISKTILDSKKQLAYEYLKKILPPVYRHNIKYWSLEEKANYCVIGGDEIHENGNQTVETKPEKNKADGRRLSDLLREALKDWIDPAFFDYMEVGGDGETMGARQILPYTYYLFDNTSRGLNNIYNILDDIAAIRKQNKQDGYLKEKKLLLDTIVSSKAIYNKHRDDIQKRMFTIGIDMASSKVYFDNAHSIIYKEKPPVAASAKPDRKSQNSTPKQEQYYNYEIKDPTERFSLFLLVDFAARLLYEKETYKKIPLENEDYRNLKAKAMEDFFFHPEVAEKVLEITCKDWGDSDIGKRNLQEIKYDDLSIKTLNQCFLLKGDLVLNLAYYRNLPLERMLKLYEDNNSSNLVTTDVTELKQRIIIAFWRALTSVARANNVAVPEKTLEYTTVFTMEFVYIRDQLSGSAAQNIIMRVFDRVWERRHDNRNNSRSSNPKTWDEQQQEWRLKRIIMNTIAQYLTEPKDRESIKETWENVEVPRDIGVADNAVMEKEFRKREKILKAIDKGKLWGAAMSETVIAYLEYEIETCLRRIEQKLYEEMDGSWKTDISIAYDSWTAFLHSYDGKSNTKASKAKKNVQKIVGDGNFKSEISYADYEEIISILGRLARNYRVWYGRAESQRVLDFLLQSHAVAIDDDIWEKAESYFVFLLQCYYKCKRVTDDMESISQDASSLAEITKVLAEAYSESDKLALDAFIKQLNNELIDEKTNIEEFEDIFSLNS